MLHRPPVESFAVSRTRDLVTLRVPVALYCLVGLGLVVQGVRYLGAAELMPYHSAVIGTPWDSLSANYQTLFLGLLKGFGAGSLCVGIAILLLTLVPFRAGTRWARWATPGLAATYTVALVYVTNFALLPGAAPITVTATLLGFVLAAAVSSSFRRDSNSG